MRYVIADAQGRFVIRNVPPGSYALVLQAPGYVISAYGHQRPGGLTRELVLEADQHVTDVVIKAWKNGVITGTVLDEAGEPAVDVSVRALRQSFSGGHRVFEAGFATTRTDDRGEYRLTDLQPGDYIVAVPSTSITVPTSTLDAYREAMSSGNNSATSSMNRDASGLGAALSNPGLLTTGGYTLLAGTRARGLALPAAAAGASIYQTMFYPAATHAADASVVAVRSGEERSGVNLQLKPAHAFRVSGTLTSPEGDVSGVQVVLIPSASAMLADATGYETATTISSEDGRFLFLGVPEGQYVIKVTKVQQRPSTPTSTTSLQVGSQTTGVTAVGASSPASASAAPTFWARVPVSVSGSDLAGVTVSLAHGARVSGRVEFEGATAPPPPGQAPSISLIAADGHPLGDFPVGRLGTDQQFTTAQYPPGQYYMSATPVAKWSLKSITVNGKDALKLPFALGPQDLSGAVVTFTDHPAGLSGTVRDRNGAPAANAAVVLFPSAYSAWIDGGMSARALRVVDTSTDGSYQFADVLPGDYLVVAYPGSTSRTPQDPAFIADAAPMATRVTVGEGEKKALALNMVTIR
jgi:hypothetical protein